MKVLVVDDDPISRIVFEKHIQALEHNVTTCEDAETALAVYQQTFYPLIVLDLELPGMNGLELCRRIRALPRGDRSMILAVTGYDEAQELRKALNAGVDDYLSKSATREQLRTRLAIIERQLNLLTQRKWAEDQLRLQAQLLDSVRESVVATDFDGQVIYWGKGAEMLYGYRAEEVLGKPITFIVKPQEREAHLERIRQVRKTGFWNGQYIQQRKDGSSFWADTDISLVIDQDKHPCGLISIDHDITNRKRTEEALNEEQDLLRALMDNIPDHIYFKNTESRFIRINKAMASWFRLDAPEHAIGKTDFDFFTDEHARPAYTDEQEIMRTGRHLEGIEEKETWPDGQETWVSTTKVPFSGKEGRIIGTFGISRDITEHKQAEGELRKHREQLEELVKERTAKLQEEIDERTQAEKSLQEWASFVLLNPSPVLRVNKDGKVILANSAAHRVLGSDFLDKMSIHDIFMNITRAYLRNLIQTGDLSSFEYKIEERYYHFIIKGVPEFEVSHFYGTDITRRKQIEKEVEKAKDAAETASRAKSEFLTNMSHEIRTPLNAILGFAEILKEELYENSQYLEYLNGIIKSGNNLLQLINDILDLSKIEAGRIDIRPEVIHLKAIIKEIQQIFSLKAIQKEVQLEISLDPDIPTTVLLDGIRLRQILFNLVGNAVKFTPAGSITISSAAIRKPGNTSVDLFFEVRDTGIGIPQEDQKRIFEPFEQQTGQSSQHFGGTGLGLAITKRLVEMMNGTISLESTINEGTVFKVFLPDTQIATPENHHLSGQEHTSTTHSLNNEEGDFSSQLSKETLVASEHQEIISELKRSSKLSGTFPQALLDQLRIEFLPKHSEVHELMSVDDIIDFAEALIMTGHSFTVPPLKKYGEELLRHIKVFNITRVKDLLALFPEIVEIIDRDQDPLSHKEIHDNSELKI